MPKLFDNELIIQAILVDYDSGLTKKALGEKYNISQPTIRRIIKDNINDVFCRIPKSIINSIQHLAKYKTSKRSIAKTLSIDCSTVRKILEYYNIEIVRPKPPPKLPKRKSKYEIFNEIYTLEEIKVLINKSIFYACQHTGFSDAIIKRYISENNLSYTCPYKTFKDVSQDAQNQIITDFVYTLSNKREIQEKYNISSQTLNNILKNNKSYTKLVHDEKKDEFLAYVTLVRRISTVVKNHYKLFPKKGYHVDHIISIYNGFKENIPPYIIASRENLRVITYKENLEKGTNSAQTKSGLYKKLGII